LIIIKLSLSVPVKATLDGEARTSHFTSEPLNPACEVEARSAKPQTSEPCEWGRLVAPQLEERRRKREDPTPYNRYTIGFSSESISIPTISPVLTPSLLNSFTIFSCLSICQNTDHIGFRTVSMP
jgi:hypothetical protein